MKTNGPESKPDETPKLEIILHSSGGYFIGIRDENGTWPFQSDVFDSREEAETMLSELNAPLPYETLCPGCKAGFTEQQFSELGAASGLWACPCSQNSLLFPSSKTVEESVKQIQEFMAQRGS